MEFSAVEVRGASAPALDQRLTFLVRPVWGQLLRSVRRQSPLARRAVPPALRARLLGGILRLSWCACLVSASQSHGRHFCGVLRRPCPSFWASVTAFPAAAMCASALSPSLCPCTAWCSRTLTACGPSAHILQAPSCASRFMSDGRMFPAASARATVSERHWSALPCMRVGGWRGGRGSRMFEAGLALRRPPGYAGAPARCAQARSCLFQRVCAIAAALRPPSMPIAHAAALPPALLPLASAAPVPRCHVCTPHGLH